VTDAEIIAILREYYTPQQAESWRFITYDKLRGWVLTDEGRARAHQLVKSNRRIYEDVFGRVVDVDARPRNEGAKE
jgi:Mn-dependent DtxR family transcriptional regulator